VLGAPCERIASSWCQRLITVSEEGARVVLQHRTAPASKVVTIHNGIPDCSERANLNSGRPPVITMVARFTPVKEYEVLLRAFAALHLGPRLRLVGDGPLRESCEALARELGIYERVEFLGNRDDVPSLLASSDIFVLASKFEMLPISALEAMRAGLPVIASEVGGVRETVVHGETGLLVPSGSVPALAQALTRLTRDSDLRLRFGRAGRRRFVERFLYERQEEHTRSVYRDVLLECGRVMAEPARSTRAA
jgi:glycosyltransferase involved in cell wall biosynthesis